MCGGVCGDVCGGVCGVCVEVCGGVWRCVDVWRYGGVAETKLNYSRLYYVFYFNSENHLCENCLIITLNCNV